MPQDLALRQLGSPLDASPDILGAVPVPTQNAKQEDCSQTLKLCAGVDARSERLEPSARLPSVARTCSQALMTHNSVRSLCLDVLLRVLGFKPAPFNIRSGKVSNMVTWAPVGRAFATPLSWQPASRSSSKEDVIYEAFGSFINSPGVPTVCCHLQVPSHGVTGEVTFPELSALARSLRLTLPCYPFASRRM